MSAPVTTRPDGRSFVSMRAVEPADYLTILRMATAQHSGRLHLRVGLADVALLAASRAAGFVTETESRHYQVPFAALPIRQPRWSGATTFQIVPADAVDPNHLFRLDEQLRQDVPGIDGWVGRRSWFDDELASNEFDPTGYQVAIESRSARLIGLVRFWRNSTIPRLGLLAVLPQYRDGYLGHRLLHAGLAGASQWGSPVFAAETARTSLQRRLERVGALHTGSFAQMLYAP